MLTRALGHDDVLVAVVAAGVDGFLEQRGLVAGGWRAAQLADEVEGDGVVAELCRMLGAEASDTAARRHAKELLAAA